MKIFSRNVLMILAAVQTVLGMEFKNCQECSKMNSGRNFMCNNGELDTEAYNVACCEPNDPSELCQPSDTNVCSGSYQDT